MKQPLEDFFLDVSVLIQGLTKEHEAQERSINQAKAKAEYDRRERSNLR